MIRFCDVLHVHCHICPILWYSKKAFALDVRILGIATKHLFKDSAFDRAFSCSRSECNKPLKCKLITSTFKQNNLYSANDNWHYNEHFWIIKFHYWNLRLVHMNSVSMLYLLQVSEAWPRNTEVVFMQSFL